MNEPTQTQTPAVKRGRPASAAKQAQREGTQTTGSSGNARHRTQNRTLKAELRAMSAKLDRVLQQNTRIARGVI